MAETDMADGWVYGERGVLTWDVRIVKVMHGHAHVQVLDDLPGIHGAIFDVPTTHLKRRSVDRRNQHD